MATAVRPYPEVQPPAPAGTGSSAGALLLLCVVALVVLGLTILYSASRAAPAEATSLLIRQVIWLGLAGVSCLVAAHLPLERLRSLSWLFFLGSMLLLILVLIPGIGAEVNGSRRWIRFGPINLQASEFSKIGLVFCLAHYLAHHQRYRKTFWRGFSLPMLLIGMWSVLILVEPDFGTAALCGAVGFTLLFLFGTRLWYLLPSVSLAGAAFSVLVYLDPVRRARILAFVDVEGNRTGSSYQLYQGLLAFASGGITGKGIGNGRQQMHYLPEAHTDFIFAIVGEELGLITTLGTVGLYLVLFLVGIRLLSRAPNLYQFLLVQGAILLIIYQALINLGVVTGLLPTKGMALPFVSYGGSNLVVMFFLIGILLNAHRNWNKPSWTRPREL